MLFLVQIKLRLIEIHLSSFTIRTIKSPLNVLLSDVLGKLGRKVSDNACYLSQSSLLLVFHSNRREQLSCICRLDPFWRHIVEA